MNNEPLDENRSSDRQNSPSSRPEFFSYPEQTPSQRYSSSVYEEQPHAEYEPPATRYAQQEMQYMPSGSGYASESYSGMGYVQLETKKGMAIAGFVLGIVSVCFLCLTIYGVVPNLIIGTLGIIFSTQGRKSVTSHGLALAGLILSIIGLAMSVLFILVIVGIFAHFMHLGH